MPTVLASPVGAVVLFVVGVVLAVWATERLLEGLVGLAFWAHLPSFTVAALLSGLEAENIAVGLAAGSRGAAPIALGSVFGGAIFLVCVALGLGALLYPLRVHLPRRILGVAVDARVRTVDWPVLVGVTWLATLFLARGRVGRLEGAVLLAASACMSPRSWRAECPVGDSNPRG
jgi:cation:H+ antiporter